MTKKQAFALAVVVAWVTWCLTFSMVRRPEKRLYHNFEKDGFPDIEAVHEWCGNLMQRFKAPGRVDDHCGWTRGGYWGNYSYDGRFLYIEEE